MEDVLIRFRLIGEEAEAIKNLSAQNLRRPTEQVRFIIRRELERRGLLQCEAGDADRPGLEVNDDRQLCCAACANRH